MTRRSLSPRVLTLTLAVAALSALAVPHGAAVGQQEGEDRIVASSMSVSSGSTTLEFELRGGATHTIGFADGRVTLDGEALGSYEPGGELERSWRRLLARSLEGSAAFELDAERLRSWAPPAEAASGATARALTAAIDEVLTPPATDPGSGDTVAMTGPAGESLAIAPGRLSVEELVTRLGRLRSALTRLGDDARSAAEDLALVVHDDHTLPEGAVVEGNLALLDGTLRLGGRVDGDAVVLDGRLVLEPGSRIEGDVFLAGGEVERAGGRVTGEFLSVERVAPSRTDAPDVADPPHVDAEERAQHEERRQEAKYREHDRPGFFGQIGKNISRAFGGVFGVISILLLLGFAGAAVVYFVRPRLETVSETVQANPARAFGVGLAGVLLFVPVSILLAVAVITIPVLPFFLFATALAIVCGYLAVAHLAGETLARRRYRYEWMERLRRSNSYYYVLSGLVLLLAPFALAETLHVFGGWLGWLRDLLWFAGLVLNLVIAVSGLGAVLISRGGERADHARPRPDGGAGTAEAGA